MPHGFEEFQPPPAPPPPPPDQTLHKWWQGIIAMCVGLAAVGTVVWFLASSFFVTKERFQADTEVRNNYQARTSEQLVNIGGTLSELSKTTKDISAQVQVIQMDIALIKASPRRNR